MTMVGKILFSALFAILLTSSLATSAAAKDEQGKSSGIVFEGAGGD